MTGIETNGATPAGFTEKPVDVALFTVKLAVAVLVTPARVYVAVITTGVALAVAPVARPLVAPKLTPVVPGVKVEAPVTSLDVPSLYIAVTVYCWVPVTGIEASGGVSEIAARL